MPILVAPNRITPPHVRPSERPTVVWTDALGRTTVFTDWSSGWIVQPGIKGLDMPPFQFYSDESPEIDGNFVRQVRAQSKVISIPLAVYSEDGRPSFLERKRALNRSLNPRIGMGTLTMTQSDGSSRSIPAYYSGGAEGDESQDSTGLRWTTMVLTFSCPSPYWLGDPVHHDFRVAQTGDFFPVLPLRVRDSQVLGDLIINNAGDAEAFPVWTVTGPATSMQFTNTTSGESLLLTKTITNTDTVVIDTRERVQTAVLNGTTNLWPNLSATSSLWAIQPDMNHAALVVLGADGDTVVGLDYQQRFLSA